MTARIAACPCVQIVPVRLPPVTITRLSVGETLVRREVLHGHLWIGFSTYLVEDTDDLLAVYLAEGSTLAFPEWPFAQWQHPWRTADGSATGS